MTQLALTAKGERQSDSVNLAGNTDGLTLRLPAGSAFIHRRVWRLQPALVKRGITVFHLLSGCRFLVLLTRQLIYNRKNYDCLLPPRLDLGGNDGGGVLAVLADRPKALAAGAG